MAILRNIQVANKYNVTPATVGNWIEQAKNRRINLELSGINGKFYIEDTENNHKELARLKEQGAKFRAKSAGAPIQITPDPRLYEVFTEDQLIGLFYNISNYNTIPVKYSYSGKGADYYNTGIQELLSDKNSSEYDTVQLVNANFKQIAEKFSGKLKANLFEIGHDCATYAVKGAVDTLRQQEVLNNYFSLSISKQMNRIRQANLSKWFNLELKAFDIDLEEELARKVLFNQKIDSDVVNICLLLFSTITNVKNLPRLLSNLYDSIDSNDYVLVSTALTDETKKDKISKYAPLSFIQRFQWLTDYLGISDYINMNNFNYDSEQRMRSRYFVVNQDLEINFNIGGEQHMLKLHRDHKITYFYSYRYTLIELIDLFRKSGFIVDQYNSSQKEDLGLFYLRKK